MKLYRGVGKTKFENDDKKLLVKGKRNQIKLLAGSEEDYAGNDVFRIGATDQYNAAYLHNYDSKISNTAFSFKPLAELFIIRIIGVNIPRPNRHIEFCTLLTRH